MATLKAKQYPYYTVYKYEFDYTDFTPYATVSRNVSAFWLPQRVIPVHAVWRNEIQFQSPGNPLFTEELRFSYSGLGTGNGTGLISTNQGQYYYNSRSGKIDSIENLFERVSGNDRNTALSMSQATEIFLRVYYATALLNTLTAGKGTVWLFTIPTF